MPFRGFRVRNNTKILSTDTRCRCQISIADNGHNLLANLLANHYGIVFSHRYESWFQCLWTKNIVLLEQELEEVIKVNHAGVLLYILKVQVVAALIPER